MTITTLPTPPNRSDPVNFAARADAFLAALPTFGTEANALAAAVTTSETNAGASASSAATSASNASAAASAAAATANASEWVSGTTYAVGDVVWSPSNFQSYRRTTAGAGTTDPSVDTANWAAITNGGSIFVVNEQPTGVSAESISSTTQQRTLNTVKHNSIADASLSSNTVFLTSGTYSCHATAGQTSSSNSRLILWNDSDSSSLIVGVTAYNPYAHEPTPLIGKFTIEADSSVSLLHQVSSSGGSGGTPLNISGFPETYATLLLIKE